MTHSLPNRDNNIDEFWKELARHDWSYERSDDHGVWAKGRDNRDRLTHLAHQNGQEWIDLYKAWADCVNRKGPMPYYRGFQVVHIFKGVIFPDCWIICYNDRWVDTTVDIWDAVNLIDQNMNIVDQSIDSPVGKMMDSFLDALTTGRPEKTNVVPIRDD